MSNLFTKHAFEAMGKSTRAELATSGIDVTPINPEPYNKGFNDRMAASILEWFGDDTISAPATEMLRAISPMVTSNQLDPIDVANKLAELVEIKMPSFIPLNICEVKSPTQIFLRLE